MAEIPDSLRVLFETALERDGDQYVVPIPRELVEGGGLDADEPYRVAVLARGADAAAGHDERDATASDDRPTAEDPSGGHHRGQQPPVAEGDVRSVTIDTLGDQGDGIAKVERGFILIVPGTSPGDQLNVRVTDVKETVAFAEPVRTDAAF